MHYNSRQCGRVRRPDNHQVPPKGFEDASNCSGNEEFSTSADTNVTQLEDLKALLSSLDPEELKQLLNQIQQKIRDGVFL